MTDEEKKQLVDAVIAELKSQGTDISTATVITDDDDVSYVICYDANGNIARVSPDTLNEKSGIDLSWDSALNLNDIIVDGVYNIKGNRLNSDKDNLPFANTGENASFAARLIVTTSPEGTTTYRHIVGQTLIIANAEGHETKVYTRSGNRTSLNGGVSYVTTWGAWSMLQGNINVGAVESLDNLIDNGIYSGVYTGSSVETFVMVVINDYDISSKLGQVRRVSQFKYSVYTGTNEVKYMSRVGYGDNTITWSEKGWKPINQDEIKTMVEDAIKSILGDIDDETLDTIKELADKVKANADAIDTETKRAKAAEKANADAIAAERARATQAEQDANFAIYTNALNSQLGGNIFDKNAVGILVNKGFADAWGTIQDREGYNITDYMAVVPSETYVISNSGTKPQGYDADKKHIVSIEAPNGVFIVPEGVYWIRVQYYQGWENTYCINKGTVILPANQRTYGLIRTEKLYDAAVTTDKIAENAVTVNKLSGELKERVLSIPDVVRKNGTFITEGTLSSGDIWELPQNSISVGEYITFSANIIGDFNALYIGHGKTNGAYMKITPNEVVLCSHVISPMSEKTFEHGLTIGNNIQVCIKKEKNSTVSIKISSNGISSDAFYDGYWYGNKGTPFVESEGCELKDCRFGWTCKAINSDIWAFGDSYFGVTGTIRWMAYMISENHTNLVVNGFGGQGSVSAYTDLTNLLTIGTPKKILWCLGMNDADSSTAVNANWLNTYNSLKAVCENNNIELILATIPTVPSRIHKFKNEIIRSSGYRYIDFDKAVGADEGTGAWFGDMLSSDGVHPSETGALTLYNRAIADMPELLNC